MATTATDTAGSGHSGERELETSEKPLNHTPESESALPTKGENGQANGAEQPSPEDYPGGLRMALLLGAVIFCVFVMSLDMTIVGTAVPKITDEFHGLAQIPWYGSAYFMTFGGFQSSWGKAYRYVPLKIVFLMTMFIFEIGSLVCGVAPNATAFIVGRVIAGLGGAGIAAGGYTVIALSSRPEKRPLYVGAIGTTYGVAAVLGPVLGGVFSGHVTWRWCFYINLPIGIVATAVILILFKVPGNAQITMPATWRERFLQIDPSVTRQSIEERVGSSVCCLTTVTNYTGDRRQHDKEVHWSVRQCPVKVPSAINLGADYLPIIFKRHLLQQDILDIILVNVLGLRSPPEFDTYLQDHGGVNSTTDWGQKSMQNFKTPEARNRQFYSVIHFQNMHEGLEERAVSVLVPSNNHIQGV
ncbi:putative Efflux pump antibiotic resistance protein [Seiridium cardinale]